MKLTIALIALCSVSFSSAQGLNDLLAAGVSDAKRFAKDYLAPISEASIYGISNSWYNTAEVKPFGGFEISIIGNLTGFKNKEDKQSFILDPNDYENLDFVENPGQARPVSTALGDIEGIQVVVQDETGAFSEGFELPSGLAAEGLDFIPSGYLQAGVGVGKGLEVKARFLPTLTFEGDDVALGLWGIGVQYEFTRLLPADKLWPVTIAGVIGYTDLDGDYAFTESTVVDGDNQRIEASFRTWNFSAVVATRNIPFVTFYGGIGYITGTSDMEVLGTYEASSSVGTVTVEDPFTIADNASSVTASLGTKIKLGFFRVDAAYNIAEFNTFTVGVNFGAQ